MRILAIISGEYGERHVRNIRAHCPSDWVIETWTAPAILPPIIDYPEEYLPETLPATDLLLYFAENPGAAQLVPELVEMTGAKAVIAGIDVDHWLPRGLARQLRGWLERMNVPCATPKPLCSLTEHDYGVTLKERMPYDSPLISAFATYFGQPRLNLTLDEQGKTVTEATVERDAVCGCARYVAEGIIGMPVTEVVEKAGLLHHHFPCLAGMKKDPDFNHDTLMHASGNVLKDNIREQVKPFLPMIRPGTRSE